MSASDCWCAAGPVHRAGDCILLTAADVSMCSVHVLAGVTVLRYFPWKPAEHSCVRVQAFLTDSYLAVVTEYADLGDLADHVERRCSR